MDETKDERRKRLARERKQRQREYEALHPDPEKIAKEKQRLAERYAEEKEINLAQKQEIEEAIKKAKLVATLKEALLREVYANTISEGVAFIVENVLDTKEADTLNLKGSICTSSWERLHQPGRYYLKTPPQKVFSEGYGLNGIVDALHELFDNQERKDGTRDAKGWVVNPVGFIKHTPDCVNNQRWHADNKHHREKMVLWRTPRSDDADGGPVEYYHYSGYSIFLGLEPRNFLWVGRLKDGTNEIDETSKVLMEFPMRSILVVSTHRPHCGCHYINGSIYTTHKNTNYSLKGFISVSDTAEVDRGTRQEFFSEEWIEE